VAGPPPSAGRIELRDYRKQLELALRNHVIGQAPVAASLRAKLDAVTEEERQREQIRNSRQTWPVYN
jgi:hypothetical protein